MYRPSFFTCLLLFSVLISGLSASTARAFISETSESAEILSSSLFIEEIRRPQIRNIRVRGNDHYSGMVLRDIIGSEAPSTFQKMLFWRRGGFEYSETEARRDVIRIERFYRRRGFYDVSVRFEVEEGRREHHRKLTFFVEEGEPTIVNSFELVFEDTDQEKIDEIRSVREFSRAESRNPLSEDKRYQRIRHPDVEGDFLTALRNSGFAFARVSIEADVDTVARKADIKLNLTPQNVAYFRDIEVEGELTVPESLIRYQSAIREGDQYSLRKMRDAQQLLFRHPLVRLATLSIPEQEEDDNVDIRIRIREQPLRTVQLMGGIGTEELIRGQITWTHRNPLGNGHRFTASTRASFIEQRANLEYLIPGFVNPRSYLAFSPFVLRKDERNFRIYRAGLNNNLTYYFSQQLIGSASYEFSLNDEAIKDGAGIRTDSTQVYNISALKFSALYNESTGDRSQGWSIRPFAEFSGFLNTGSIYYQRFSLDVRRFIDITSTTQLALRVDSGLLFSGDPFDTPANIRFYAGGSNSVRGYTRRQLGPKREVYDENGEFQEYLPLGGQSMLMFNSELRQDLPLFLSGFQLVAFLDGGQVFLNFEDTNLSELNYSAGGGIRYMSPIGPIRLDVGWKLNPTEEDLNRFQNENFGGINRWAIHFSIGQAF